MNFPAAAIIASAFVILNGCAPLADLPAPEQIQALLDSYAEEQSYGLYGVTDLSVEESKPTVTGYHLKLSYAVEARTSDHEYHRKIEATHPASLDMMTLLADQMTQHRGFSEGDVLAHRKAQDYFLSQSSNGWNITQKKAR